jgi:hypothetical protein
MESKNKFFIYINAFYDGFIDRTDANNINFFEMLFKKTNLYNFEITNDLNKANVLLESCFGNSICKYKKWDKTIFFSGESQCRFPCCLDGYDIILKNSYNHNNIIDLPLSIVYITNNNLLNKLIQEKNITNIPPKFCCFCVSNANSYPRNKMFSIINSYKKVDSLGHYNNNVGFYIESPYWSEEYLNQLKKYKFIICFENSKDETYVTEKIVNAYLSNSIPIYWGTEHVKNMFYDDSMIYLNDENNEQSYYDVLNRVIELDNDDLKYFEFINHKTLKINYFEENYSIDKLAEKINNLL